MQQTQFRIIAAVVSFFLIGCGANESSEAELNVDDDLGAATSVQNPTVQRSLRASDELTGPDTSTAGAETSDRNSKTTSGAAAIETTQSLTPTDSKLATRVATPVDQSDLDYYFEVGLGAEFGGNNPVVRKWTEDVKIEVLGTPNAEDEKALNEIINDLNRLIEPIDLSRVNQNGNVTIHIAPTSTFPTLEPNYVPGNEGFFWTRGQLDEGITSANILVSSDSVTQAERSHLLREELTQSLGLMRDSDQDKDSIFYTGWTETTKFTQQDEAIIKILYDSRLKLGMDRSQIQQALG